MDFSTYKNPGVYVEEDVTPLVSVVGLAVPILGIVGPSVGYRIDTEAVTLTGVEAVRLARRGINTAAGFQVRATDGTLYEDADYVLAVEGGADASVGTTEDNTVTIARSGASAIPDGATVLVSFRYTDADYFSPNLVEDYDDAKDLYGEPFDTTTGEIVSPLTLAAKVAFENGARRIVLVATRGTATLTTAEQLRNAYPQLDGFTDVGVVVPLTVGIAGTDAAPGETAAIGEDLESYVESRSADGLFRVGILGYEKTVTRSPVDAIATFKSSRVMVAWPNNLLYYNGYTNQNIEVGGYYLAAGYGGRMSGLPPQIPLTRKGIRGFAGIAPAALATMTNVLKNSYSDAGVAVTELDRNGRLQVRHGTSTDRTNINTREMSLTRAKDGLVRLIQNTTEAAELIGTPIVAETPMRVKGIVAGALETAVTTNVIVNYNNLKVRQRSLDPSVIEVKFQYLPAYPLNYIVIAFSINLLTGSAEPIETPIGGGGGGVGVFV